MFAKFSRDLLFRAAHACAVWAAALRHKAIDYAVKSQAIIEAVFDEFRDLLDMFRRKIRPQQDRNIASFTGLRINGEDEFIGHYIP
jgi:hypothetical protein